MSAREGLAANSTESAPSTPVPIVKLRPLVIFDPPARCRAKLVGAWPITCFQEDGVREQNANCVVSGPVLAWPFRGQLPLIFGQSALTKGRRPRLRRLSWLSVFGVG